MSTKQTNTSLLDELAKFFASGPSKDAILQFRLSKTTTDGASQLLELNRTNGLDEAMRRELDQFGMAESLMRRVKALIRQASRMLHRNEPGCCHY